MEQVSENLELSEAHIADFDRENFISSPISGISPRQQQAIQALLSHPTYKSAAESCGVAERTIRTWLSEDSYFQEALAKAQIESFRDFNRQLSSMSTKSLEVLYELATNPATPAGVRQRSATSLMEAYLRAQEISALDAKIAIIGQINNLYDNDF